MMMENRAEQRREREEMEARMESRMVAMSQKSVEAVMTHMPNFLQQMLVTMSAMNPLPLNSVAPQLMLTHLRSLLPQV